VRVTDLARSLGMSMPTISRHLATWRTLGFVDKPEGQETYRLSLKVLALADAAVKQNDHASIAYPFLVALRDEIAETVLFVIRVEHHAVNAVSLDSGRATTVVVREGTRVSLPFSPSARLIWAFGKHTDKELDTISAASTIRAIRPGAPVR
jgi:DNA-binding IclR family transcriptional regulator